MDKKVNRALLQYVTKPNVIKEITSTLKNKDSQLIEITGASGTGKTYLFERLKSSLEEQDIAFKVFSAEMFRFNQFGKLIQLLSDISIEEYKKLVDHAEQFNLNSKYDFYYYLTETLNKEKKLSSKLILVDNCNLLDQYTIDFIQYLVQYAHNKKIHFIAFTNHETFPFSHKRQLEFLTADNILQVIATLFPGEEEKLDSSAEILHNLTEGNIFILEHFLNRFFENGKAQAFDLSKYLDEKITTQTIHSVLTESLNPKQLDLAVNIFLLDQEATEEKLNLLCKYTKSDLTKLITNDIIRERDDRYAVRKAVFFKSFFKNMPQDVQRKAIRNILKNADKLELSAHSKAFYQYLIGEYNAKLWEPIINTLRKILDLESLREIYNAMIPNQTQPAKQVDIYKNLGIINRSLNRIEASAENFRQALKLCTAHQLPAEEIVYRLADSLFSINSSAFALEIIRKYQGNATDPYWKSRMILLQTDILIDQEKFDEAIKQLEDTQEIAITIKNEKVQTNIFADIRKFRGKVFYSSNQWEKAEMVFKDAERLYNKTGNLEGLAAVSNNIGVITMLQGEWDKTLEFFEKSLRLEKQRFNLNGISVCYNNLGALHEDKGDYKESMDYLYKALHIQKMLSDRKNVTNIYNNIGVTYMNNAEFDKSADAFDKSLETALTFNLTRNIIGALNNLGALYFKSGNWSKAIEYYENAIERSKENSFLDGLCRSYNNLGAVYEKRGEFTMAYDLYFKGLEIVPDLQDEILKAELYGNLGSILTHLHKYGKAYAYLVESYDFFKSINSKDKLMIEACQKQAYYFIQTRNYESAVYYLEHSIKMSEETNSRAEIGNSYYLMALLERKNIEVAQDYLKKAIEIFIETKHNFELAQANYEYACILFEKQEWEQALQILENNKKVIKYFDAINFLEKNDILIQKITKEHAIELKESRSQESLLNRFYEITQKLNTITDFDVLIDSALDNLVNLSEADGGILCLYSSSSIPEAWEYLIFKNFSIENEEYDILMQYIQETYTKKQGTNIKQPHEAPQFNNVISFPLIIRNNILGVVLLFSMHGSHYFTEKMYNLMSALCNQIVVIIENIRHSNLAKSHAIIREELNAANWFTNIIGKSERMQEIFQIIDKIKNTPTTVLLEGPSGTGKELIARAIHYTSNRRNKKFVAQYCGALPETLLESELFGHVKGSFTGAAYDKKGLFEIADGGTFFLDEIADISLSTQAKLLRFLQEGEIKRVGSTKTTKVDVRVICATNVSLSDKVKSGEFRLDLYYRLNVIKIKVPSLKERKSDIPLLGIHFLDKYNKKMTKNVLGITDEAMKYLQNCDWPGNIRQLENEIERAVTLAENDAFIKPSDLSEEVFKYAENAETVDLLGKTTLKDAVEDIERKMIVNALESRNYNQTQASKDLGLSRQGLIKKMKRYGLDKL